MLATITTILVILVSTAVAIGWIAEWISTWRLRSLRRRYGCVERRED